VNNKQGQALQHLCDIITPDPVAPVLVPPAPLVNTIPDTAPLLKVPTVPPATPAAPATAPAALLRVPIVPPVTSDHPWIEVRSTLKASNRKNKDPKINYAALATAVHPRRHHSSALQHQQASLTPTTSTIHRRPHLGSQCCQRMGPSRPGSTIRRHPHIRRYQHNLLHHLPGHHYWPQSDLP
jgi:hypothetical protein